MVQVDPFIGEYILSFESQVITTGSSAPVNA